MGAIPPQSDNGRRDIRSNVALRALFAPKADVGMWRPANVDVWGGQVPRSPTDDPMDNRALITD